MKKLIIALIASVIAILLGGFILCFPQFVPFGATLIAVGSVCFISFGVVALFVREDAL